MAAPSQSPSPAPPTAPMAPASRGNRPMIVGPEAPELPYPLKLEGSVTKGFGRGARFLGIPTANLPDSSLAPLNDLQLTGIYYGFARVHPSTSTPAPSTFHTPAHSAGPSTPTLSSSSAPDPFTHSNRNSKPAAAAGAGEEHIADQALDSIPTITAPYPPDQHAQRWSSGDEKVWPMVMSVGWNPYFKNEKITAEVHIMHPFKADFYGHHMSVLVLGYIRPELDYVSKEALIEDIQTDVKVALNGLARPDYASYATDDFLVRHIS